MNQECKIVDEEEMSNFRRFKPEDLEKKYSPFERVQKKEFPFLFQKKQIPKESTKTCLEDIIAKFKDLSCNLVSPLFKPIENPFPGLLPLTPLSMRGCTPNFRNLTPLPPEEIPFLDLNFYLNLDLSGNNEVIKDGNT